MTKDLIRKWDYWKLIRHSSRLSNKREKIKTHIHTQVLSHRGKAGDTGQGFRGSWSMELRITFATQKVRTTYWMKEGKLSVSAFTDLNLRSTLSGPSEARESGWWPWSHGCNSRKASSLCCELPDTSDTAVTRKPAIMKHWGDNSGGSLWKGCYSFHCFIENTV